MEQNTDDWLAWRKEGIGASDTPIILGVSRFKTPFILWSEKLGLLKAEGESYITELGHRFEPVARSEFALKEGIDLEPTLVEHKDMTWLRASLDGFNESESLFGEIKYIGQDKFDQIKETGEVLEEHRPQIQHQYFVTGLKKCVYIVYTLNEKKNEIKDCQWIWPKIDERYIEEIMLPAVTKFWKNLKSQTAPELMAKDVVKVKGKKLLANKYIAIKNAIETLKAELEIAKDNILDCSKHPNFEIGDVKVCRYSKKGKVSYKKVPQLKGVDLDPFRGKPTMATKLTVKTNV